MPPPARERAARGFWQFEKGAKASRGGVWGVFLHSASRSHLEAVCRARNVPFEPVAIWAALERDDILAACVARLLLWTDPKALPAVDDAAGVLGSVRAADVAAWQAASADLGRLPPRGAPRVGDCLVTIFGRLIPAWVPVLLIGVLLVCLLGQRVQVSEALSGADRARAELAYTKTRHAQDAKDAEAKARETEALGETDKQQEFDHSGQETELAQAAARAADSVRKQLAAYIAAVRGVTADSGASERVPGQQGADALDLLAGLYSRSDEGAGELARYAGQLFIAGGTCERIHDGLTR